MALPSAPASGPCLLWRPACGRVCSVLLAMASPASSGALSAAAVELQPVVRTTVNPRGGPFGGSGATAIAALQDGSAETLAIATFGGGVWLLDGAGSSDEQDAFSSRRLLMSPGFSATSLAALPGDCIAAGGNGVRLLNTSLASSPTREGRLLARISGVNALLWLAGGSLAVGSDSGLHVLASVAAECGDELGSPEASEAFNQTEDLGPGHGPLAERFVYALAHLQDGRVAAGTDQGVWLVDAAALGAALIVPVAVLASKFSVFSLQPLSDGGLAAGTLGRGVLLFTQDALAPGGRPHAVLADGLAAWSLALLPQEALLVGTSAWGGSSNATDTGDANPGALLFPRSRQVSGGRPSAVLARGSIVWSLAGLPGGLAVVGSSDGVALFDTTAVATASSSFDEV